MKWVDKTILESQKYYRYIKTNRPMIICDQKLNLTQGIIIGRHIFKANNSFILRIKKDYADICYQKYIFKTKKIMSKYDYKCQEGYFKNDYERVNYLLNYSIKNRRFMNINDYNHFISTKFDNLIYTEYKENFSISTYRQNILISMIDEYIDIDDYNIKQSILDTIPLTFKLKYIL